jgi:predicted DCC family thiol-disulfide oxidoreductase YuxK
MNQPDAAPYKDWVLYDDSCGFCNRWIPFWAATLSRQGLGTAPLQADWVSERLKASPAELIQDLRLSFRDGSQIVGADVYRYVMRRIWWAWPLYVISIAPVASRIFDWSYRTFAANRYRVSQACRLGPRS